MTFESRSLKPRDYRCTIFVSVQNDYLVEAYSIELRDKEVTLPSRPPSQRGIRPEFKYFPIIVSYRFAE